jgi:hypothetical protein
VPEPHPQPPAPGAAPDDQQPPRPPARRPPRWAVPAFLLLLVGFVVLNFVVSHSGPPVAWIENDLPAALRQAAERKQRVFLYLYEPNDPLHGRNEREVFGQNWARAPLQQAAACRIAVQPGDLTTLKHRYTGRPVFVLLDEKGREIAQMRLEGAPDEREFFTYIGKPIRDFAERTPTP